MKKEQREKYRVDLVENPLFQQLLDKVKADVQKLQDEYFYDDMESDDEIRERWQEIRTMRKWYLLLEAEFRTVSRPL